MVEFCELMADLGKTVIVAALDGTYQRQVVFYISIEPLDHQLHFDLKAIIRVTCDAPCNIPRVDR